MELFKEISFFFNGEEVDLEGIWERVGDEFAGCRVAIEKESKGLVGWVVEVPPSMEKYGWEVGDLKWKKIQKMRTHQYSFQDLFKEMAVDTKKVTPLYQKGTLSVRTQNSFSIESGQGSLQKWRRYFRQEKEE